MLFSDRLDAGRQLARNLTDYVDRLDVVVLALPRGGVPVAGEVARRLRAPLDVFTVRKLCIGRMERAVGALASGGARLLDEAAIREAHIPRPLLEQAVERVGEEIVRLEAIFRRGAEMLPLRHKTLIVVDDGLVTGATMQAAVAALRQLHPARIIAAVPVGSRTGCARVTADTDALLCPHPLAEVGSADAHYGDFLHPPDTVLCDYVREVNQGWKNWAAGHG